MNMRTVDYFTRINTLSLTIAQRKHLSDAFGINVPFSYGSNGDYYAICATDDDMYRLERRYRTHGLEFDAHALEIRIESHGEVFAVYNRNAQTVKRIIDSLDAALEQEE